MWTTKCGWGSGARGELQHSAWHSELPSECSLVSTLCGPTHVLSEKLLSGCLSMFRGVLTAVFTVKLGSVFSRNTHPPLPARPPWAMSSVCWDRPKGWRTEDLLSVPNLQTSGKPGGQWQSRTISAGRDFSDKTQHPGAQVTRMTMTSPMDDIV